MLKIDIKRGPFYVIFYKKGDDSYKKGYASLSVLFQGTTKRPMKWFPACSVCPVTLFPAGWLWWCFSCLFFVSLVVGHCSRLYARLVHIAFTNSVSHDMQCLELHGSLGL
jgi:hypothetical protein